MTNRQHPEKGLLLVISGCAGTGKGTVISELRRAYPESYDYSISATTRSPRPGEINGEHYYFVSRTSFEDAILRADMLEYTEYCGNYYGTPRSELYKTELGKHLILEIEVEGASNIKRLYPGAVTVFIAPPSLAILENRLRGRGTSSEEDIRNRMRTALAELSRMSDYDYIVVNEDNRAIDAAEIIHAILRSEQHKTARQGHLIADLAE